MESAGKRSVVVDRVLAAVIDLVVAYVLVEMPLIYGLSVVFPTTFQSLGAVAIQLSLVLLLPVWSTYSFAFEWQFARTPGKVARRLLVVTEAGEPCPLLPAAIRNLARYVDVLGVGVLLPLVADGRRVGDYLAGTRVVRTGTPQQEPLVGPAEPGTHEGIEEP
jgi:uncharacterized RDD family membrane protein YckC